MAQPQNSLWALVLGGLLCLLLAVLHNNGALTRVEDLTVQAAAPFQRGIGRIAGDVADSISAAASFGSLADENAQLRDSVGMLRSELARLRQQSRDDSELVAAANFAAAHPEFELVPATVVSGDGSALYELLQIDRGANHGLDLGMAVISLRGLVGRLVDVSPDSAWVLPISSPDSSVAVSVQGNFDDVIGSVQGTATTLLEMDNILLGADIEPGQFVITSGLGSRLPRGILVGHVINVRDRADIITRSADVQPAVNPADITQVLVVVAERRA